MESGKEVGVTMNEIGHVVIINLGVEKTCSLYFYICLKSPKIKIYM